MREVPSGSYSGHLGLSGFAIEGGAIGNSPIALGNGTVTSAPELLSPVRSSRRNSAPAKASTPDATGAEFVMAPVTLDLGGKEPALLEGRFDQHGYSLHLYGNVLPSRLMALADAVPQFGDGLHAAMPAAPVAKELPVHIDVSSSRVWGAGQTWAKIPAKVSRAGGEKRH